MTNEKIKEKYNVVGNLLEDAVKNAESVELVGEEENAELSAMETIYYIVETIDGDYANLRRTDEASDELKLVARALLPEGIGEGTRLKYECFEYEIV